MEVPQGGPGRWVSLKVDRRDLRATRLVAADPEPPRPGQVLFEVSRFGFSMRDRIDQHSRGQLAETIVAGLTQGAGAWSPGGRIISFFAPDRIRQRSADWGWPVLEQRFTTALHGFAAMAWWLRTERSFGPDGAAAVYRQILANTTAPDAAHVVDMACPS